MDHDWRDIENTVWVQDVPRRSSPIPHEPKADDFPSTFERVLYAINVAPAITSLVSTNVSRSPHIASSFCAPDLVLLAPQHPAQCRSSWCTSHALGLFSCKREAHPEYCRKARRLACCHQIRAYSPYACCQPTKSTAAGRFTRMPGASIMETEEPKCATHTCVQQGSSIGTYSASWLSEFILSAKGSSPEALLDAPKTRRAATPMPLPNTLKILFPTRDWVRNSVLGEAGGGTMFCRKRSWEAAKFPRNLFYESRSRRGRVLMHSKVWAERHTSPY